ncbi:MAG: hypothetical protein CL670_16755 [Balneola sp.]|jgi:thioredoxin-related protein|nr:hypothetical protein [Balneola sp.]MBE80813.1 hypothetical protein [Balneola sp.]|tara:strand:+ start:300 stop:740 length:441 start_codon:yes stop_codon:yes gene_type:complete
MQKLSILLAVLVASILFSGLKSSTAFAQEKLDWKPFEEALSFAESEGLPIFVDVWAPWCGWCRKMKRDVYPELAEHLSQNYVLTRINRDDNETMHSYKGQRLSSLRLAQKLNIQSVPGIVLLNSKGEYVMHLSGFIENKALRPLLE